jgi:hypothetical protein
MYFVSLFCYYSWYLMTFPIFIRTKILIQYKIAQVSITLSFVWTAWILTNYEVASHYCEIQSFSNLSLEDQFFWDRQRASRRLCQWNRSKHENCEPFPNLLFIYLKVQILVLMQSNSPLYLAENIKNCMLINRFFCWLFIFWVDFDQKKFIQKI